MGSSVRRADGHGRILAGRWLPLSIFNLDTELGYEPDLLAGLQVRKRGLTDALAEEGVLALDPRHQDVVDALFWQRLSDHRAGRALAGVADAAREPTVEEIVWQQWRDDPAGTAEFMRAREPGWRPPQEPRVRFIFQPEGVDRRTVWRWRREALQQLREWCEKWVETELLASEIDEALEEAS